MARLAIIGGVDMRGTLARFGGCPGRAGMTGNTTTDHVYMIDAGNQSPRRSHVTTLTHIQCIHMRCGLPLRHNIIVAGNTRLDRDLRMIHLDRRFPLHGGVTGLALIGSGDVGAGLSLFRRPSGSGMARHASALHLSVIDDGGRPDAHCRRMAGLAYIGRRHVRQRFEGDRFPAAKTQSAIMTSHTRRHCDLRVVEGFQQYPIGGGVTSAAQIIGR